MGAFLAGLLVVVESASLDGAAAFERLKKLEGTWRSKDGGQTLALRLIGGGEAVLETVGLSSDQGLSSVGVLRLEGADLVLVHDGPGGHGTLKLVAGPAETWRFEAPAKGPTSGPLWVSFTLRDAETLRRTVMTREKGKEPQVDDFTREYLDTLK